MDSYNYQNTLISKKQLRQLLAWSFTNYDSVKACELADELKSLGFKYASQAGISINIEDLKVPFVKTFIIEKSANEILNAEKTNLIGKITNVEKLQKIIDTWNLTSESLKEQVVYYFKNYDPLNSLYLMAFSGARGNLSQVRQLVGMRGLMSDPNGQIMDLAITKNFREGLTITDYLMSGYGARKGIIDTALKTANSGYLTRRLIDVGQDILIREKDCLTKHSFSLSLKDDEINEDPMIYNKLLGRTVSKSIINQTNNQLILEKNKQITSELLPKFKKVRVTKWYMRSPLVCNLYRAICQKCYGWDLATENLINIGEAVGILAGQSIGEPGTQLTMRTFHTGGIFTSKMSQQILSPISGILKFDKNFKKTMLRTNRGEEVSLTKNSGILTIIPEQKSQPIVKVKILRDTIIFPRNNQYITKNSLIGELINSNKQVKTEIKPILSDSCGEIFMPLLKTKSTSLVSSKSIWIFYGSLYSCPKNSFINFYSDYKLNRQTYIFRTKILNSFIGKSDLIRESLTSQKQIVHLLNNKYFLDNVKFEKLFVYSQRQICLLTFNNFKYVLKPKLKSGNLYLEFARDQKIGTFIRQNFKTFVGGTIFYDYRAKFTCNKINHKINCFNLNNKDLSHPSLILHRTIVWLTQETYNITCESDMLLVEQNDFIPKNFEIISKFFSKTSGLIVIQEKSDLVQSICIKTGICYEGKNLKSISEKLYYPGEIILDTVQVKQLCFCESALGKVPEPYERIVLRPVDIYEFAHTNSKQNFNSVNLDSNLTIKNAYSYIPKQTIHSTKNLDLVSNVLIFNSNQFQNQKLQLKLFYNKIKKSLTFQTAETLNFDNYILPQLRYKNLKPCFLFQMNQFIDQYTILGYLESLTLKSQEIVKFKLRKKKLKQILLISNDHCFTVKKSDFPEKKINNFLVNQENADEVGRVLIDNGQFLTVQKGRSYFFPDCKNENIYKSSQLHYKTILSNKLHNPFKIKRSNFLNYHDITKIVVNTHLKITDTEKQKTIKKTEFAKLFLKQNGKLYSSLIPKFFKKFSVKENNKNVVNKDIFYSRNLNNVKCSKIPRTLLFRKSNSLNNNYTNYNLSNYEIILADFLEYPCNDSAKAVGIHAITEDYLEQEVNHVFCKNNEFVNENEPIGSLHLEKEISGDIVQGLPRIEEILEARKKNSNTKVIPLIKKKNLLVQKTTLDPNLEFKQLGTPIKKNEKINPHKLLKVYFNYYGLIKSFVCQQTKTLKYSRLLKNNEGSYKSFKKVQMFILKSVQSVYESQGVRINNKHLEVIIKQMTTKVLITYEGDTSLLRREVIDLYHIEYINNIIKLQEKQIASYVPLLLGITKASLDNPSFISAASFQETTNVLTKAAIEGKIDWLRGLKENIIVGQLIPVGTGSKKYSECFKKF